MQDDDILTTSLKIEVLYLVMLFFGGGNSLAEAVCIYIYIFYKKIIGARQVGYDLASVAVLNPV